MGQASSTVETALLEELDQVGETGTTHDELERAKSQLRARMVFENDSVTNVAHQLGFFETVADLSTYAALPSRIAQVSADDVARVARAYLASPNRTVGWFEPAS